MILATICLALAHPAPDTVLHLAELYYGSDIDCVLTVRPFQLLAGRRSVSNGHLLLNGSRVWKWSMEDGEPETAVVRMELYQGKRILEFPLEALEGLVDLVVVTSTYYRRVAGNIYLDRKKQNWVVKLHFSDAGASFGVYFSGSTKAGSILREVEKDRRIVDVKKVFSKWR